MIEEVATKGTVTVHRRPTLLLRLPFPFRLRVAFAPLVGALLLAIGDTIDIVAAVPIPPRGIWLRAEHHVFSLLTILSVGFVSALLLGSLGHTFRHRPGPGRLLYWGVFIGLAYLVLGQDLRHQADYVLSGVFSDLLFALLVALCGAAVPVAHALGAWCGRRRFLRWIALVLALGGIVTSHLIVRDDYAALHAAIDWTSATLAFATLGPLVRRAALRRRPRRFFGVLAMFGLAGLVIPTPNRVRVQLFRTPSAIGAWALANSVWRKPESRDVPPLPIVPDVRTNAIGKTEPPLFEGAPVVVMITIDATRADVVLDPQNAPSLPLFTELARTGITFTNAVSPGSQTSVSLSTMFAGRYFSQTVWARHGVRSSRYLYPAEDKTVRFPEILTKHGVSTELFGGTNFLADTYGVARGFSRTKVPDGRKHAMASDVIGPLLERLHRTGDEPTFLYAHIMEPHSPYDRGKRKGTDMERYLSEVVIADTQVGKVARALSQRFPKRGVLIVSADHGEAFGEHGTFQHTKTLYEELLRVPLFVRGPNIKPRRIDTRVSLIDIGPTLLDLFGIDTPATFMGETLVPIFRGKTPRFGRLVLAEGRLRRALYIGQLKVIEDTRRKVVEAYDLDSDPKELVNLFDVGDERADQALATLRAFFDVHALRKRGYSPPYKP